MKLKKDKVKTAKDVATGIAVGSLLGAAAGVLLAPKSGEDLRKDISDKTLDGVGKAKEFAEKAKPKKREELMIEVGRKKLDNSEKVESIDKL